VGQGIVKAMESEVVFLAGGVVEVRKWDRDAESGHNHRPFD